MHHDAMCIVDRYIHRYLTTIFQLDYQAEFGKMWDDVRQHFSTKNGLRMAMYREYEEFPIRPHKKSWSNDLVYPINLVYPHNQRVNAPLPKNY